MGGESGERCVHWTGSELLSTETICKLMYFRVRTIGSKGPSPWSDAVVGIVL